MKPAVKSTEYLAWLNSPLWGSFILLSLITLWMGLVSYQIEGHQNIIVLGFLTLIFCLILHTQTEKTQKLLSLQIYASLIVVQALFILLFQQLPQSQDIPPDSLTYHLHGSALAQHLQGLTVDANTFGLQLVQGETSWTPDSDLNFPYVAGSSHFLYQAYLGALYYFLPEPNQQVAALSQILMLAALPIMTYRLAMLLFSRCNLAFIASVLVAIDTRFTVNAIWLLKDTLLTFTLLLFLIYFFNIANISDQNRRLNIIGLLCSLIALFCLRTHVAMALWLLASGYSAYMIKTDSKVYLPVLLSLLAAYYISGFLKLPIWEFASLETYLRAGVIQISSLSTSTSIVINSAGITTPDTGYMIDSAIDSFYQSLINSPLTSVAMATSRTLFAPYPWTPMVQGFEGTAYDLYFPGMIIWLLCLPFFMIGIVCAWQQPGVLHKLLVIFAAIVAAMYIISFGEFSTRQRQFLTPLFWVWTACGILSFREFLKKRGKPPTQAFH